MGRLHAGGGNDQPMWRSVAMILMAASISTVADAQETCTRADFEAVVEQLANGGLNVIFDDLSSRLTYLQAI